MIYQGGPDWQRVFNRATSGAAAPRPMPSGMSAIHGYRSQVAPIPEGEDYLKSIAHRSVPIDPRDPNDRVVTDPVLIRKGMRLAHSGKVPECPSDRLIVRMVVISGDDVDRDEKILEVDGLDWMGWDLVPTWEWCHDWEGVPIGVGLWRAIYRKGNSREIWADVEFTPKELNEFGWRIGLMHAYGFLRACSLGWMGTRVKLIRNEYGEIVAVHHLEGDVYEISSCPIPMDRRSVQQMVKFRVDGTPLMDDVAQEAFARAARFPSLSKGVAYDVTDKILIRKEGIRSEVMKSVQRPDRGMRARKKVDTSRVLIEEKTLDNPWRDGGPLFKPGEEPTNVTKTAESGARAVASSRAIHSEILAAGRTGRRAVESFLAERRKENGHGA